jgi:hypothetical protein
VGAGWHSAPLFFWNRKARAWNGKRHFSAMDKYMSLMVKRFEPYHGFFSHCGKTLFHIIPQSAGVGLVCHDLAQNTYLQKHQNLLPICVVIHMGSDTPE